MSTSVTEQADQEIPLGLPRADALETSDNVPASPTSCPLEGRALTFSSPVPVVAVAVSRGEQCSRHHAWRCSSLDRLASITMNDMLEEEDRHDDMLKKAAHEQAGGKIGQHDAKIQSFQERIDQAEEQIRSEAQAHPRLTRQHFLCRGEEEAVSLQGPAAS